MARGKKNVEPQKLGGQIYNGTQTLVNAVIAWQGTFPPGPPNAPAGQGIYNGLNPQCRLDKVGPGIDAPNQPTPSVISPDNYTSETRFTWPEAVVAGVAEGWHIQGSSRILDCSEQGTVGVDADTPYRFVDTSALVTSAQVTVLVYRFQNGFSNFCVAGDMQNRLSPFYSPGVELIYSNTGLVTVVAGAPGNPATFAHHSFNGRIKTGRELKVDDTIVTMVRVRSTFDSAYAKPGVVTAMDCTGFYCT